MSNPGPHFLNDFKKKVLDMTGRTCNPSTRSIVRPKLKEVLWGNGPYSGAHRERARCFVGREAARNITFIHGLAREFCQRQGKEHYAHGGSNDPYG